MQIANYAAGCQKMSRARPRASRALEPFRRWFASVKEPEITLGYVSLRSIMSGQDSSVAVFAPPIGDPGLPNAEFTQRICDGIVSAFQVHPVFISETVEKERYLEFFDDPFTVSVLARLNVDRLPAMPLAEASTVNREPDNILFEARQALRFGFAWDVVHFWLREVDGQEPWLLLAHAFYALGNLPLALKHFEAAQIGTDPMIAARARMGVISCLMRLAPSDVERARIVAIRRDVESLVHKDTSRISIWLRNLEAFLVMRTDIEEAAHIIDTALALTSPGFLPLHHAVLLRNRAKLVQPLSEPSAHEISLLEQAIDLRPFDQDWRTDLARLLLTASPSRALTMARSAHEPGMPLIEAGLIEVDALQAIGESGFARARLNEIVKFRPSDAKTALLFGNRFESLGEIDSATSWYQAALAGEPDIKRRALKRLLAANRVHPGLRVAYLLRELQSMPVGMDDSLDVAAGIWLLDYNMENARVRLHAAMSSPNHTITALASDALEAAGEPWQGSAP